MLTRRTNVLLTEQDYSTLSFLATKHKKTIAALIREALRQTYQTRPNHRQELLQNLETLSAKVDTKNIDYKALVEHGRRY